MNRLVIIYTVFANLKEAKTISEELLKEKLVACVNIFPEVNSLYLWMDRVNNSRETVAIMKSRNDHIDKTLKKIEAMHSYNQPSIMVIPIKKANKSFIDWVNNVLSECIKAKYDGV
ncbi:MAG: divalent-cation tolerance protein CutA [Wolbachia endosymbiont of Menacanthus eurysternus]|nr:MAG: divalent-cation tolerance protein CutA [Wolbachia endosymbiont of Menacanthus eurysternus]